MTNSNVADKAVLYGGLGNTIKIEINGAQKFLPIEPVGVIVIGIDGLRQDVLYKYSTDAATSEAAYNDPTGCGGSCYVPTDSANLPGLSQILKDGSTIKLKNVTAIFPSITLASWASIFTGKMPGETGILGNEFFARDLSISAPNLPSISVPPKFNNPPGLISFSSGAFEGYDEFGLFSGLFTSQFFIPYQLSWKNPVDTMTTPQNNQRVLLPETVYESVAGKAGEPDTGMANVKSYFNQRGGDPVVVANSHYARGAYWLTWDIEISSGESQILDKASWDKLDDYLGGKYITNSTRNNVPFSALTVWYLPGLDHEAHKKGMGIYSDYFKKTTDSHIKTVVDRLKGLDEFDNKIFIIVADHGMTAMPWDYKVDITNPVTGQVKSVTPETSCKLRLEKFDAFKVQVPEQANNNLHIWELGEMFKAIGKSGGTQYKVLAPQPIANLYSGTTSTGLKYELPYGATATMDRANVIAALNGPMAHIYLKGANGWSDESPDIVQLSILAKYIKRYIQEGGINIDNNESKIFFNKLLSSVDRILIREEGVYKDFKGVEADATGNAIGPNAAIINETYFDVNAYVAAFTRIKGMNHPKRSGDIVLIMKDAVDIPVSEIASQRFTTGVACKSWHGSLNRSDSYVPLIIAYPGGNKLEMQSLIDTTPGCNSSTGCDGNWRVTDLIQTIVEKQYGAQ